MGLIGWGVTPAVIHRFQKSNRLIGRSASFKDLNLLHFTGANLIFTVWLHQISSHPGVFEIFVPNLVRFFLKQNH